MTTDTSNLQSPFCHSLSIAIAKIVKISNFDSSESNTISTLCNIAEKLLINFAIKSKNLAEISQRSKIIDKDLILALIQDEIDLKSIINYVNDRKNISKTDAVDLPEIDLKKKEDTNLCIGPRKCIGYIAHAKNVPELPDLHTFKSTACYIHHQEDFCKLRVVRAERKIQSQYSLTSLFARSEYQREPGIAAHAFFGGKEIEKIESKIIKNKEDQNNLEEKNNLRSEITVATNWKIMPLILDKPDLANGWSPYAQAIIPTISENELLLKYDKFLDKKRVLKPRKELKKMDRRCRNPNIGSSSHIAHNHNRNNDRKIGKIDGNSWNL